MAEKTQDSVWLVTGDDEFLIDQKARAIVDAWVPEAEQALGLEIIEGSGVDLVEDAIAQLDNALEAVRTTGFFGGRKVVWLRKTACFTDAGPGKSKEVKAHAGGLTDLIKAGLPEGHRLVVSGVKVDRRSAFYKACKSHGQVDEFVTPTKAAEVDQSAMERVEAMWEELGIKPDRHDVLAAFVARVGADTRQLQQESHKLACYVGADRTAVTHEYLDAVVVAARESIAWSLADHVGERKLGPALQVFRQLLFQRESEIGLIFGLENRFRELLLLRECMRRRWLRLEGSNRYQKAVWALDAEGEAALAAFPRDPRKTHPYRLVKLIEQANRYTLRELLKAQQLLAETHERMVSSSLPPAWQMELLLIRLVA